MTRNIIYRGVLAVMSLLAVACNKTDIDTPQDYSDRELVIKLSAPRTSIAVSKAGTIAGTADEDFIKKLTVLIYDDSGKWEKTITDARVENYNVAGYTWQLRGVKGIQTPSEQKTIYIIANWEPSGQDVTTENKLNEAYVSTTNYNSVSGGEIPMIGKLVITPAPVNFVVSGNVELTRHYARIDLKELVKDVDIDLNNPDIDWDWNSATVQIKSVPTQSYLLSNSQSDNPVTSSYISGTPTTLGGNSGWSFYTPENLNGGDKATYLKIAVPYRYTDKDVAGTYPRTTYYQVFIPAGDNLGITTPSVVKRNTVYEIEVTILGKGDSDLPSSPVTYSLAQSSSPSIRITNFEVKSY